MVLTLCVPGASSEALERGIAAAQSVLEAAGVSAADAAYGHWAREEWKMGGSTLARPTDDLMEAAAAFSLAQTAASEACCSGHTPPAGSSLRATDA